ncbi:unnamed protein product [Agarophyton chilense]|eukprot:gb/GEZJ01001136.1/.p1 GENE.gb/GEZJ01001136.1/~~gb/GEZJ01001136.1/.p1  ORF type:complete len:959 (+),score=136.00 gb/GEZJ01001136.1/:576-3452(+)
MDLDSSEKCTGHGAPVECITLSSSHGRPGKIYFRCSRPLKERCKYFRVLPSTTAPNRSIHNNRALNEAFEGGGVRKSNPTQRRKNLENSLFRADDSEVGNIPKCRCGSVAARRTVRKEGRNKGKIFFACQKPVGQQCGFFEWDNHPDHPNQGQSQNPQHGNHQKVSVQQNPRTIIVGPAGGEVQAEEIPFVVPGGPPGCQCDLPAVEYTVKKQGPNRGRKFFVCQLPREKKCRFFQWADEVGQKRSAGAAHQDSSGAVSSHTAKRQKKMTGTVIDMSMDEIDSFKFIMYSRFPASLKDAIKQYKGLRIEKCNKLGAEEVIIPLDKVQHFETLVTTCAGAVVERNISDDLLRRVMKYSEEEIQRQKRDLIKTSLDEILPPLMCEKLMQFQWEGVNFALKRGGRCLIGDDMGLGKTLQAIAVARIYMTNWPLLIICPSSLRINWKEELLNWLGSDLDEEDILVMMTGKDTTKNIHRVNIVSYDLVRKIPRTSLSKCQFIIADESHYLKSGTAKRTQAVVPMLKAAKRAILLSGTPALSRPVELFSQINALAPGLFPDYHEYVQRYCNAHYGFFGYDVSGASNLQELNILLRGSVLIRRKKEDVLTQLPDKQRQVIWVQTKSKVMKELTSVHSKLLAAKDAVNSASNESQAMSLQMAVRAAQNELYSLTGQAKLDSILEFCRDTAESGCKFIVFAHHALVMGPIFDYVTQKLRLDAIRIDGNTKQESRQSLCSKFQTDPSCKVAVLSITAAGVGITLTEAKVVLFAELYWNPGSLLQAEDRAHRIGQKDCVLVQYLLAKNTIDESMWETVRKKLHVVGHSLTGTAGRMEVGKEKNEKETDKRGGIESYFKKAPKKNPRREVEETDEEVEDDIDEAPVEDFESPQSTSGTPPESRKNDRHGDDNNSSTIVFPTRMAQLQRDPRDFMTTCDSNSEKNVALQRRVDADRALAEKLRAEFNKDVL